MTDNASESEIGAIMMTTNDVDREDSTAQHSPALEEWWIRTKRRAWAESLRASPQQASCRRLYASSLIVSRSPGSISALQESACFMINESNLFFFMCQQNVFLLLVYVGSPSPIPGRSPQHKVTSSQPGNK